MFNQKEIEVLSKDKSLAKKRSFAKRERKINDR
jgi:hypothetical protein